MNTSIRLPIEDDSYVSEARRAALRVAADPAFDEDAHGRLAIVATELTTNLVKHAAGGELVLRAMHIGDVPAVELLALDKGPGLHDVGAVLRDGFSTAGSPGSGLGAIRRLSTVFDLYTEPDRGTALLARVASGPVRRPPSGRTLAVGAVCLPAPREQACGDAWLALSGRDAMRILVVDGLGHGPTAAAAAQEAVRVYRDRATLGPSEALEVLHAALRSTRGAGAAVAQIALAAGEVRFAGAGNIAACLIADGATRSMASMNGTLGVEARKIREFRYPWTGGLLVMHSDGLATRWTMDDYPGLSRRDPALIAGVLYRDFLRGRDDVTVVVAQERTGTP